MKYKLSKVRLTDYFDIVSSVQDDKINFELSDKNDPHAVPFLGRSSTNNGIVDYVTLQENKLNEGGVISIALDGSTGSTFFQHVQFCSGQNIWLLKPRQDKFKKFTPLVALFCITSIRKAVANYSYNLGLTKTRLQEINILLKLKGKKIDVEGIEKVMSKIRNVDVIENLSYKIKII